MQQLKKLKRAVIKEELVALTGNFINAVILNQLIYWSERMYDVDEFIEQEKIRAEKFGDNIEINIDKTHGWIYKTAEELSAETLLNISKQNMRLHLKELVKAGYVQERENPKYKWDKTKQYRVDMVKIQNDLRVLGYELKGYVSLVSKRDFEVKKNKLRENNLGLCVNNLSPQDQQKITAIPEITTEITTETCVSEDRKKEKTYVTPTPPEKQIFGYYKNVVLSEEEIKKLGDEFPNEYQEMIERLSEYMESSGAKYKNHFAVIRSWLRSDKKEKKAPRGGVTEKNHSYGRYNNTGQKVCQPPSYDISDYENTSIFDNNYGHYGVLSELYENDST